MDPVPTFLSFTSLSILSTCTAETRPWPLASQLTSISISRRHRAAQASGVACWPPGAKGPAERISQAACSETLALPAESLPLGCAELDCAELNFCTSSPRFLSIACCSWPCTLQQRVTDNIMGSTINVEPSGEPQEDNVRASAGSSVLAQSTCSKPCMVPYTYTTLSGRGHIANQATDSAWLGMLVLESHMQITMQHDG